MNPLPLPAPEKAKKNSPLHPALMEQGINSNLAGVTNSADIFSEPGTVTFTGIFRAKGNEAGMVYIINAQDCFSAFLPRDLARVRNRLFTAITRSKAWVRVLGVGPNMSALKEEFESVKASDFKLLFDYPTEEQRQKMTIVNRDMSKAEKEQLDQKQHTLQNLLESLESVETFFEDYPEDTVKKLQEFFNRTRK
jgi:superfamily I DNA and RNA helicase